LKAYCDTSFLVSLYSPDVNSAVSAAEMRRRSATLLITPLCELELVNALQLRLFRKELTVAEVKASHTAIQSDIALGVYWLQPLSMGIFEAAKRLSLKHVAGIGSRSLDVLHVAAAIAMGADVLFSFDEKQRRLAKAEGLRVAPAARGEKQG
jgi:predicted nucleic acid-binding protein